MWKSQGDCQERVLQEDKGDPGFSKLFLHPALGPHADCHCWRVALIPPKAGFPPWRERRRPGSLVAVCHPAPAFFLGLRLPPTYPGARNLESTRPAVLSGFRHPAAALDTGGREGETAARLGRCILFTDMQGGEGERSVQEKVRGCCGPAEQCSAFGPHLDSKRLPGESAPRGNLPGSPRRACDPLQWPPGHCHSRHGARGSQTLGPAAALAALMRPHAAGRWRMPCRSMRPVEEEGTRACARELPGGGRAAPLEAHSPLSASPNP
nr:PREDICTED: uncharacterized protein LOC109444957 [Rhinolophus sinicus]